MVSTRLAVALMIQSCEESRTKFITPSSMPMNGSVSMPRRLGVAMESADGWLICPESADESGKGAKEMFSRINGQVAGAGSSSSAVGSKVSIRLGVLLFNR